MCQSEVAARVCADLQLVPDQIGEGEREGPGPEPQHSKPIRFKVVLCVVVFSVDECGAVESDLPRRRSGSRELQLQSGPGRRVSRTAASTALSSHSTVTSSRVTLSAGRSFSSNTLIVSSSSDADTPGSRS